ncbi:carotenoid 1,2-hydratase [Pyxidicoccus trucidator]|uniref:carotenoid 1,2-hydratase n=1 Tax=Pyxidicoccus trucidator TaxID=2709662 RepID=UPI0013DC391C|nr:carotenoid 1,2-hydratase [Pyxidicoccus trucidator]
MRRQDSHGGLLTDLAELLPRLDYFRRSPARLGGRGGHKEWQYFLVNAGAVHLLINFSLQDDPWAADARRAEVARLTLLALGEEWQGGLERFPEAEVHVSPGCIDARFGASTLRFEQGRYLLDVSLREHSLAAELELVPMMRPLLFNNHPLAPGENLSWVVVPRLEARGTVTLGGRTHRVEGAPAYHDHNWGHFRWGGDFSWEWAHALPSDAAHPWSAVFVRMMDRRRTRVRYQSLFLWRSGGPVRTFRDRDIRLLHQGHFQPARRLTVPPEMALLAPGLACDLPAHMELAATSGADSFHFRFDAEELARVITPGESEPRTVSVLNELSGRVVSHGCIGGEPFELEATGIYELIRD